MNVWDWIGVIGGIIGIVSLPVVLWLTKDIRK